MFFLLFLLFFLSGNKTRLGWDEMFTIGGKTSDDDTQSIVQVWTDNNKLADVVAAGLRGFVSSKWYLNNGGDWSSYYTDDPMSYIPANASAEKKKLVLGGEACMWMSAFDADSNMVSTIWPNAAGTKCVSYELFFLHLRLTKDDFYQHSFFPTFIFYIFFSAMAEQLWSGAVESVDKARTRLSQQRCRMIRRGFRSSPIAEDFCGKMLYVRKSRSFEYPGNFPPSNPTPPP